MHISEVEEYRRQKDHLMRNEGAHPANYKGSWRDEDTKKADQERLRKAEEDVKDKERRRDSEKFLYGKRPSLLAHIYPNYKGDEDLKKATEERNYLRHEEGSYED